MFIENIRDPPERDSEYLHGKEAIQEMISPSRDFKHSDTTLANVDERKKESLIPKKRKRRRRRLKLTKTKKKTTRTVEESTWVIDVTNPAIPVSEAAELFYLIFDPVLIEHLSVLINSQKNRPKHILHRQKWVDINDVEIKRFVGLLFFMGIERKSAIRDYWIVDEEAYNVPSLGKLMSKERFDQIFSCFQGKARQKVTPKDLEHLKVAGEMILKNSRANYTNSKSISINYSHTPFQSSRKLIHVSKSTNRLKVVLAVEPATGFVLNCEFLFANEGQKIPNETILHLLSPFKDSGFSVCMDSDFTSNELFLSLLKQGIKACGRIPLGEVQIPESLRAEIEALPNVACKQYVFCDQTLGIWRDGNETLCILSTCHCPQMTEAGKIPDQNQMIEETTSLPAEAKTLTLKEMVADFSANIGGVSEVDKRMSQYSSHQLFGGSESPVSIFYSFLEIAMVNSYLIHVKRREFLNEKPLDHRSFRVEVIQALFGNTPLSSLLVNEIKNSKECNELGKVQKISNLSGCFLVISKKASVCKICSPQPAVKKVRTSYKCQTCEIAVCVVGCYDKHRRTAERKFQYQ